MFFPGFKRNKIPPSLRNIITLKELASDISSFTTPEHGDVKLLGQQGLGVLENTVFNS